MPKEVMDVQHERTIHMSGPFDDSAGERLVRMGLLTKDGKILEETVDALGRVFAGLLFDALCDSCQDYAHVQKELQKLFASAESGNGRQQFLLICLQYDQLCQPLPDPIWWISGNPVMAGQFAGSFIRHLQSIGHIEKEVPQQ